MDTEWSDSYLVVKRMIGEGDVSALELADLLIALESQGLISAGEHVALLKLAAHPKLEDMSSQQVEGLPAS